MKIKSLLPAAKDEVSQPFFNLLNQRMSNKITQEEFDKEICYGFVTCLGELKYKPNPSPPVRYLQMKEYLRGSGTAQKKAEVKRRAYASAEIVEYIDECFKLDSMNHGNGLWLERCILMFLKVGDYHQAERFKQVYDEYPMMITQLNRNCLWKKRMRWNVKTGGKEDGSARSESTA